MKTVVVILGLVGLGLLSTAEAESPSKAEISLYKDIVRMELKGVHMDYYRQFSNTENDRLCVADMREFQPQVETIIKRAEKVGNFNLNAAALGLRSCLTCADNAIGDCERLGRALLVFWQNKAELDF